MRAKEKALTIPPTKANVKGTQNSTKTINLLSFIITHQFIGGNYDETFN